MDVTPLMKPGRQVIQSYAAGQFKISGEVYSGPVIVTADQTLIWKTENPPDNLCISDFDQIENLDQNFDVVLLGCGKSVEFITPKFKSDLKNKGITIEAMDTGAACRTYNVMVTEERRVAAVLYPRD